MSDDRNIRVLTPEQIAIQAMEQALGRALPVYLNEVMTPVLIERVSMERIRIVDQFLNNYPHLLLTRNECIEKLGIVFNAGTDHEFAI